MANVLQLSRKFDQRPAASPVAGTSLRHFAGPVDIEVWLELRRRAFAKERFGVRDWSASDYAHEFLEKPWWIPTAQWFAELLPVEGGAAQVVGTVTLARRGAGQQARPVIHWLAVHPAFRRRGIGRLLVGTLEAACWDAGDRQVWLETHVAWGSAVKFYEALGYRRGE